MDRSFERLYRLHRSDVYGASLRELRNTHDAEDVTQAAFVDAYRAILRGSRPDSPRAWLLAIAENVRRRRFRAALRRPREAMGDVEEVPATELPRGEADALLAALQSLPQPQREVFLLREIRGLSYDEIAARVRSSVPAVQMLLFRARRALRAELDPPSVTRRLALSWPPWLVHLAGRGDRFAFTPRGAGAVGAAALVIGGSTAGVMEIRGPEMERPAVADVQQRVLPASRPSEAAPLVHVSSGRPANGRAPKATPARRPTGRSQRRPVIAQPMTTPTGESAASSPNQVAPSPAPNAELQATPAAASSVASSTVAVPAKPAVPATTPALPEPSLELPAAPVALPPPPVEVVATPPPQPPVAAPALPPVELSPLPPVQLEPPPLPGPPSVAPVP